MTNMRIYLLDFGTLQLDGFQMYWGVGPGGAYRFPVCGVLIDHPEGKFLFDTGFDKDFYDRVVPGNGIQSIRQTVPGQLHLMGIRPSEISHVINSHYHADHCGGNKYCTHAKTICHTKELQAVLHPEPYEEIGYADSSWLSVTAERNYAADNYTPRVETITQDTEVAKGLSVIETPGHTAGHCSLLVRPANRRPMLFAGDACYSKRSMDENIIADFHVDVKQSYTSLARLRSLSVEHDAELFYAHDPELWPTWRKAPLFYG